jgi:uncharacterized UPF0160 family protein
MKKNDKTIKLLTHSGPFHADDIFATACLNLYFKNKEPNTKLIHKRSIKPDDIADADIVYDIGLVYNPKKLRFDHHQNDNSLTRPNGIPYAAFGLVFKHFGPELISMISGNKNKKYIAECFDTLEKKLVQHIDSMDNGKLTYKNIYEDVDVPTIDNYFTICKSCVKSEDSKEFDKKFYELVKVSIPFIENMILYSINKEAEKSVAIKAYNKAKDKRIIICERFYNFSFNKFPEPLVVVYPDSRGGWSAKNVHKGEELYDARFYFPESWRGLVDEALEKACGVKGAKFCHKSGFLIVNETKDGVLEMINKAFELEFKSKSEK